MNILVSACLLGVNCRYNGEGKLQEDLLTLQEHHHLIPICPEQLGGLPTPRPASEIQNQTVFSKTGIDVTAQFKAGAIESLKLAKLYHCSYAILKERSPSCGFGQIYDGSFTGSLITGNGITANLLAEHGITVIGESKLSEFIKKLQK
ncbi:DUF523 domain-containing protein [Lachnoclostridium phytofermentans]|uniref:DUF523 domain-containing protein n=1 Tax=Lachnoclostridium phytofermentans TaxID=66219 RepID=UPI000497974C|nr:DUF523 domain-containing protein [Lachnoclostridium phytofermentans]